jgi:hypothetical protein
MTDTNNTAGLNISPAALAGSQALEHAEVHFIATLNDEHRAVIDSSHPDQNQANKLFVTHHLVSYPDDPESHQMYDAQFGSGAAAKFLAEPETVAAIKAAEASGTGAIKYKHWGSNVAVPLWTNRASR